MTVRGIFFDAETAQVVRGLLVADGYTAEVLPERYAGEDDDEDHAWAVLTDAPVIALEMLVDAYEGWLEDGTVEAPPIAPLDLPAAPKRLHRDTDAAND